MRYVIVLALLFVGGVVSAEETTRVIGHATPQETACLDVLLDEVKGIEAAFQAEVKEAEKRKNAKVALIQTRYENLLVLIDGGRHFGVPFNYNFTDKTFITPITSATVASVRSQ